MDLICLALLAVGGMQNYEDWMNLVFVWLPAATASLVSWSK